MVEVTNDFKPIAGGTKQNSTRYERAGRSGLCGERTWLGYTLGSLNEVNQSSYQWRR